MLVYKYRGGDKKVFERDLLSLKNNTFFAPKPEYLNDPCETLILTDKIIKQTKSIGFLLGKERMKHLDSVEEALHNLFNVRNKSIGIYSLSKTYKDELLWAHYANSHTGFCIEYDLTEILKIDRSYGLYSFDIIYNKKPPQYTISDINKNSTIDVLKKMAGYKSLRWNYEKEHRIITDFYGYHSYNYNALKAIYFGLNMAENQKLDLIETLKGRGIMFYQVKQIENTYLFERELVHVDTEINYLKQIPNEITGNVDIEITLFDIEQNRFRASVKVELEKQIHEKEIQWLAEKIKEERFFGTERIFIFFYLKGDIRKEYCWATSHYTPELEIKIMGPTESDLKELNSKTVSGDLLCSWRNMSSLSPNRMFLVKENGNIYMKTLFPKTELTNSFSEAIEEITQIECNGSIKLIYNNYHGEFYVIEDNGNLGLYSETGKFDEAIKDYCIDENLKSILAK